MTDHDRRGGPRDSVDRILADWARTDPALPVAPVGVITRLARLRAHLDEELSRVFARFDLSGADFAVLAALRRAGPPYRLAQSTLMDELALTSGTVSTRLNRLTGKGLVGREPNPADARGAVVVLTEAGQRLFDEVAPAHLRNEEVLLSALSPAEQEQLAGLLRRLLVSFEHPHADAGFGLTVAPAHRARRLREAVALPDRPGLLVEAVAASSAAAAAGLQPGDVLTELAGRPLRSVLDLAAAGPGPVVLTRLRGADRAEVTLRPDGAAS